MANYGRDEGYNLVDEAALLALKQDKTDNNLATNSKNTTQAINEVFNGMKTQYRKGVLNTYTTEHPTQDLNYATEDGVYWLNTAYEHIPQNTADPYCVKIPEYDNKIYAFLEVKAASEYIILQTLYNVDIAGQRIINYIWQRTYVRTAGEGTGAWSPWAIQYRYGRSVYAATADRIGGIKPGDGLQVDANGVLSLTAATADKLGGVKVQAGGLAIQSSGRIILTPASESAMGGIYLYQNGGLEATEQGALKLKPATYSTIGGVIIDNDGLSVNENGILINTNPPQS